MEMTNQQIALQIAGAIAAASVTGLGGPVSISGVINDADSLLKWLDKQSRRFDSDDPRYS